MQRAEATEVESLGAAAAAIPDAIQAEPATQDQDQQEPKELKKKKNRCLSCKKKVGLTGKKFSLFCGRKVTAWLLMNGRVHSPSFLKKK